MALVHATTELKKHRGSASCSAAAALADATIALVAELIGHDLRGHRNQLSEAAHFGGLLAAAEEAGGRCEPGFTHADADAVLACVQAQFRESDMLAEQLTRWSLEAGYFLVRSGGSPQDLLNTLRTDLVRLLDGVDLGVTIVPARRSAVPHPATAPDQERLESIHH